MTDEQTQHPEHQDTAEERMDAESPQEEPAEETVRRLREEVQRAEDERVRAWAETENTKKRLEKEKTEYCRYATESVLADLLPVLDNLDLALAHGQGNEACKGFVQGVEMTRKVFLDILRNHGLEPVGDISEEFNPEVHEAVGFEQTGDVGEGRVCKLVQKGYRLKGRLVRPARVLVAKPC